MPSTSIPDSKTFPEVDVTTAHALQETYRRYSNGTELQQHWLGRPRIAFLFPAAHALAFSSCLYIADAGRWDDSLKLTDDHQFF